MIDLVVLEPHRQALGLGLPRAANLHVVVVVPTVLVEAAGLDGATPSIEWVRERADKLYKDAAKTYHPDAGGPLADASVFGRITLARDVLKGDA